MDGNVMETKMMETKEREFLPLGSVVIVKGSVKKLVLIARAVFTEIKGERKYFDYGACTYPEGVLGENVIYFRHRDIAEVIAEGYSDEDDRRMVENIRMGLRKLAAESSEDVAAGR